MTQQASPDSGWLISYEPFLGWILDYLKEQVPQAKIYLNETWAYAKNSVHKHFGRYHYDQKKMYEMLHDAYKTMAEKYRLPLIPSGTLIQKVRDTDYFRDEEPSICRDGFHMSHIYGRYAVACMWAKYLFGISLQENTYVPTTFNVPVGEQADIAVVEMIRKMVDDMGV